MSVSFEFLIVDRSSRCDGKFRERRFKSKSDFDAINMHSDYWNESYVLSTFTKSSLYKLSGHPKRWKRIDEISSSG
jgi:hypothetical protein